VSIVARRTGLYGYVWYSAVPIPVPIFCRVHWVAGEAAATVADEAVNAVSFSVEHRVKQFDVGYIQQSDVLSAQAGHHACAISPGVGAPHHPSSRDRRQDQRCRINAAAAD
jgi:hypothetical protein